MPKGMNIPRSLSALWVSIVPARPELKLYASVRSVDLIISKELLKRCCPKTPKNVAKTKNDTAEFKSPLFAV
jgi:oligoribonuclease (3'-5' exoribonuclease)